MCRMQNVLTDNEKLHSVIDMIKLDVIDMITSDVAGSR
jgi:hypothetical protein